MPQWYYEKKELKDTPSYLAGLPVSDETRYRREGARFIQEVGKTLGLRHDTMATASVYFHRFYMFHTFLEFPRYVTATCALFLAGKAEETPKKCRDLIKTVRGLTNDQQFGTFGQVRSNLARGDLVMSLCLSGSSRGGDDLGESSPTDHQVRPASGPSILSPPEVRQMSEGRQSEVAQDGTDVLDFRQ